MKIGGRELEQITVSHYDDTDAIQLLRIVVGDLPASGFTYLPQGAPFDTYETGQSRIKGGNGPATIDPESTVSAR